MSTEKTFEQIKEDVIRVIQLNEDGKEMSQIADILNLSLDYIQTILICAQGFTEDDPIAVAHLVEMGL